MRRTKLYYNQVGLVMLLSSEPELYKMVIAVTHDDYGQNIYTLPVGKCNQQTSVEDTKYFEKHNNALIVPCEYISKK